MQISTIGGNVGNIVEGTQHNAAPMSLLEALQTLPAAPLQAEAAKVYDDLKRALAQEHPDEMTVRELFTKLKKISLTVAEVAWTTWKNPLKGLGILLETLTDGPANKQ